MQDGCYCSTLCLSRTGSGGALGPALLGGGGRTPGPRHPRPAPAAWPSPPAPPPRAPATVSLAVAAVDTQEPLDAAAPGRRRRWCLDARKLAPKKHARPSSRSTLRRNRAGGLAARSRGRYLSSRGTGGLTGSSRVHSPLIFRARRKNPGSRITTHY
jgi:hypothetical protein